MKKHVICAAIVALLACLLAVPSMADTDKYISYNSVHSTVKLNANGTANVTMQIEAVLPAGGEETELTFYTPYVINQFSLKNFSVTGTAACSAESEDSRTLVTLGGDGVTGEESFTITYDIQFANDLEDDFDWFDIGFFLDRLKGDVRQFSAEVTCPDTFNIQEWKVLDDFEGAPRTEDVDVQLENNVFHVRSTKKIGSYDEVVLHVECDAGAFSETKLPAAQCVIQQRACTVAVSNDMTYTVSERITIQVNAKQGYITLPVLRFKDYDERYTAQLMSKSVNVRESEYKHGGNLNLYLDAGDTTGTFDVEYTYTARPESLKTPIEIRLGNGDCDRVDNMMLNFTAPGLLEADVRVQDTLLAYAPMSERIDVTVSGDVVTATLKKPLYDYETVMVAVRHNPELYVRKEESLGWLLPICAVFCLIVCVLMKALFGTPGPLQSVPQKSTPTPPQSMTSAEVGYLKDGVLTAEELSTLVLKWVAMDAVAVQECDGEYILSLRATPSGLEDWEQELLRTLFSFGSGGHVTTVQLRGKLDEPFATAQQAVHRRYQGELALQTGGAGQWACMAIAALPMLLLGVLSALAEGWGLLLGIGVGIGCMAIQFLLSCLWLPVCRRRTGALAGPVYKITRQDVSFVLLMLGCAVVYTAVLRGLFPFLPVLTAAATILVCLAAALAGALFLRRRPMAQALLSEVHAFYGALAALTPQTMHKAQCQSQRWCYEMLPYAMVLGLTGTWKSAARGADVPAPSGIHGAQDFNQYAEQAQRLVQVLKRCAGLGHLR